MPLVSWTRVVTLVPFPSLERDTPLALVTVIVNHNL